MSIRYFLLLGFGSLCFIACQPDANQSSPVDKVEEVYVSMSGRAVYDMYCVACHGANGKMMFSGASDLSISKLDLQTRITQIKNGKGVMNAFKNILNEEEIEEVAVYVEELRIN